MKKINISIKGMHCQSCVTLIEKSLNKVSGVKEAVVNLTTERASVSFDDSKLKETDIIGIIKKGGYKASIIQADEQSADIEAKERKKELQKLKKSLIFSLIFAIPAFLIG